MRQSIIKKGIENLPINLKKRLTVGVKPVSDINPILRQSSMLTNNRKLQSSLGQSKNFRISESFEKNIKLNRNISAL